jgi:hypothetical protein
METLQRTANRGSVSTGYDVANSLKFEADNTEYLTRDVSSAGNRDVGTISMWIKRTEISTAQYLFTFGNTDNDNGRTFARFQTDDTLRIAGGSTVWRNTDRVFRDTSAWYHIVIAFDTTQSTANDRFKLYVNGVQETSFSTTNNPSQNDNLGINFEKQVIGYNSVDNDSPFAGYMCEICYQDGTASAPTEFGEFDSDTGIWKPINVASKPSGTNKFYLDFEDSSNLGNDVSGGTDFTENNIAAIDQATDTCTNNFCIFNAIQNYTSSTVLSDGGTLWDNPAGQNFQSITGTFAVASGKWYWEVRGAASCFLGIADTEDAYVPQRTDGYYVGYVDDNTSKSIGMYSINGQVYNAPGGSPDGTSYGSSNMIGFALDMDNRKMWISKDGTFISSIGDPTAPSGGVALTNLGTYIYPAVSVAASNGVICAFGGIVSPHLSSHTMTNTDANGYGAFKTAPPSGYYSLCSKNLAEYG